jgi:hypothetical protein
MPHLFWLCFPSASDQIFNQHFGQQSLKNENINRHFRNLSRKKRAIQAYLHKGLALNTNLVDSVRYAYTTIT